jgi:hypothetical protein
MVCERLEFILSTQDTCSEPSPDGLAFGLDLKCFDDRQRESIYNVVKRRKRLSEVAPNL